MPRAKERGEGKPLQTQDSAWLDGLVDELYSRMAGRVKSYVWTYAASTCTGNRGLDLRGAEDPR